MTRIPPASRVARRPALVERCDLTFPASRATPGSLADLPASFLDRSGALSAASVRQRRRDLGPPDRGIERWRGHRLALQMPSARPARHAGPRRSDRPPHARPAPSSRAPAVLVGAPPRRYGALPWRAVRPPAPGPAPRPSRLRSPGSRRASPRTSAVPLSTTRASSTCLGQTEALGDGERLAPARQPDREPIGRRQRLKVELDRGIARRGDRCGLRLQLA